MRQAGSTISIPTKLLATGVACALAVVVCGTAASVVVASDATRRLRTYSDARKEVSLKYSANKPFRDVGPTARLIDSLLAPLGIHGQASPLDVAVITSLNNLGKSKSVVWDVTPIAEGVGPVPEPHRQRPRLERAFDTTLSPSWIAAAATDTATPWLPLFRRWARSNPLPSLWGYRLGLPGVRDARDLPIRSYSLFRSLFQINEEAGVLALQQGRNEVAAERALENISASRHFLEQPIIIDALVGRSQFRRGLRLLSLAAAGMNDSATLRIASRLDTAAKNFVFGPRQLVAESEDPNSRAAEQVIANLAIHPSFRIEALSSIVMGGCRNTPEIVLGFKESRREAMLRAVQTVSDIPRGSELARQYTKYLEYAMSSEHADVEPVKGSVLDRNELLKLFSWIIPPGVRARAKLCLEQG